MSAPFRATSASPIGHRQARWRRQHKYRASTKAGVCTLCVSDVLLAANHRVGPERIADARKTLLVPALSGTLHVCDEMLVAERRQVSLTSAGAPAAATHVPTRQHGLALGDVSAAGGRG